VFEIGNSLRDARLRQGLELADLELQTKIRAKYLKALEEEQFELLPGDTYIKGFLRTYAERLGLDGQLYVDEYNSRFANSEEPVVASHPRRRARSARAESHAVIVALAGIIGVTVLVIAAWKFGASAEEAATTPSALPSAPAETESGTPPATEPSDGQVETVELVVTAARGSSRIEVRQGSAFGQLVWEGTLQKGQSQVFNGVELWLQVGKPGNLEFALDGRNVEDVAVRGPVVVVASANGLRRVAAP
jgi:cytoskeletal protein RodZ